MIVQERQPKNEISIKKLNIIRLCEKLHCLPSQLLEENDEWVGLFEINAKFEFEKEKRQNLKRNLKNNGRSKY